jgi:hypothetical protein
MLIAQMQTYDIYAIKTKRINPVALLYNRRNHASTEYTIQSEGLVVSIAYRISAEKGYIMVILLHDNKTSH